MTSILKLAGEALYGPRWQSELARDMAMSDRHMRRLAAETADFTPSMAQEIINIMDRRQIDIERATSALSKYIAQHQATNTSDAD